MKTLILFLSIFLSIKLFSQTPGLVVVTKDPRIDLLLKKQGDANAAIRRASARTARGYRILVLSTNSRDEAVAAKTKIYTNFPELKAYLNYQSPYFKLKAGNFRTRDEALVYQRSLNTFFPLGVFVVSDTIEITPEKESSDN